MRQQVFGLFGGEKIVQNKKIKGFYFESLLTGFRPEVGQSSLTAPSVRGELLRPLTARTDSE